MKQRTRRFTSFVLAAAMLLTAVLPVSAADKPANGTAAQHIFDKAWDKAADAVVGGVTRLLLTADSFAAVKPDRRYPTVEAYKAAAHDGFFAGTDGAVSGDGWKLGYSRGSVIPAAWRRNAAGSADPNGMCLSKARYFGGYFGCKAHNIYDDEQLGLAILSVGSDRNANGVEDILIYASLDNIGMANGNVRDVRAAAVRALEKKGVSADDVVAFELNCTHAHTVIEALGMGLSSVFLTAMKNHFLLRKDRAIEPELLASICGRAAACAEEAYDNLERGSLYYFETPDVNAYFRENAVNPDPDGSVSDTIREKTKYGAAQQTFFACWLFEGESGARTILANTGVHPTNAGRHSDRVTADVPYYMAEVMREEGYNFLFIQGAQAAIGMGGAFTAAGKAWAEAHTLTYEDWVARYGEKYASKHYNGNKDEDGEGEYFTMRAHGYDFAHLILDSVDRTAPVAPTMDVRMDEIAVPLDYGIMYIAAVSGVFGYNTVRMPESETGYGVMTEIGCVALGSDTVLLMLPGEVSPALVYGTRADYTGTESWQGEGSWRNEAWPYKTIEAAAREALGADKRVLCVGLANDELGYIMPDTDCARNFLTKSFFDGRQSNEELMEPSAEAGSALVRGYCAFFGVDSAAQ